MTPTSYQEKRPLVLKTLIGISVVFLLVLVFRYWQQNIMQQPIEIIVSESLQKHFSDLSTSDEVIKGYAFDAKIIHDIESYQDLKTLFFKNKSIFLSDQELLSALQEVLSERTSATEFSDSHVYNASYYVGNLLVLPRVTLHELLLSKTRSNTTTLLETALADVRAGVVKLGDYFDQAPPSFYNQSLNSTIYFINPSYPSLTIVEAGTVLFILAELDPVNAFQYEVSLQQYANQVIMSGGHFRVDIEAGLKLVELYFGIIKANPIYLELIAKAKTEWQASQVVTEENKIISKFEILNFPYLSQFSYKLQPGKTFVKEQRKEELTGSLKLTLVDNRLPSPAAKLYEYNFSQDSLLPGAVDLLPKNFPHLGTSVGLAKYVDKQNYYFISGQTDKMSFLSQATSIFYRDRDKVESLIGKSANSALSFSDIRLAKNEDKLLYVESNNLSGTSSIFLADLNRPPFASSLDRKVTEGKSPLWVNYDQDIIFWHGQIIYSLNLLTKETIPLLSFENDQNSFISSGLDYAADVNILTSYVTYLDGQKKLNTKLVLYKLNENEVNKKLATDKIYEINLSDAKIFGAKLSPGGNFLAILIAESRGDLKPRLLLFDLINGIILKEVDLSPYSTKFMSIDDWVLFD